jgi:cellulose synthase/poly-beta-1,6-N-acetylglucosamine synthase-like glycosyltransferase
MGHAGESRRMWQRRAFRPDAGAPGAPSAPLEAHARPVSDSRRPLAEFPELACVRHRLPVGVVAAAERRAREVGMTADHVILTAGLLTADAYVGALAQSLGVPFEPLTDTPRAACPLDDDRLVDAAAAGLLPLRHDGDLILVVAPQGVAARRFFTLLGTSPAFCRRIRMTSAERLRDFIVRHGGAAIGARAVNGLRAARPDLSAAPGRFASWDRWGLVATMPAAGLFIASELAATALGVALACVFLAWVGLRLFGVLAPGPKPRPYVRLPDRHLPVYTIIVALYREAAAVAELIAALDALDYPPEKLDIKLVLEADDAETRDALARMHLRPPYELLVAPDIGPRTKPKALNVALPFARGAFTTVYDAEDRPERDQLRRAFDAFTAEGGRLACVQARLTIDNTEDSLLTRLFTAEYAGLFDVFLPGLATRALPLPLGGSSNHFRTSVLRQIGGWDPYNITEDADLGVRLARAGYVTGVISSTTYEEAPARLRAWLKQRTRWFEGWMQTWLVHMRSPARLWRELGPAGFATVQLVVGGTVLASLVHPLFIAALVHRMVMEGTLLGDGMGGALLTALYSGTFIAGYAASAILGLAGLAHRRLMSTGWVLVLVPAHWVLLSVAAWYALYKLVRDPYRWDKTEHGLARTSRMKARGRR